MAIRREPIAVVDDDPRVLKSLANLLSAHGYRTELFASAEDFLIRAPGSKAACLVTDVGLNGMSGLDLAGHPEVTARGLPVIFISGSEDDGVRAQAAALGAVAYLRKPFRAGELLSALSLATQTVATLQRTRLERRGLAVAALHGTPPAPAVRIIKKQSNRRLLETARNRYVSHADLRLLVMQRTPLVVLAKDGRDITRDTLLQVVMQEERSGPGVFTSEVLTQLIRISAGARPGSLGPYLEKCVRQWFESQDKTIS